MSREVLAAISHSYELAPYATHELRGLFNDWLGEIELRVIDFVNKRNRVDPKELSSHFKLTTESIIFVLGKLEREGKITTNIKGKSTASLRLLKRGEE